MDVKREWLETDYYKVLGVSPSASDKEITKAYRQLARKFHPDANPGDTGAEEKFKEVSAAYDVLGNGERRAQYDQVRHMGPMNFQAGPGGFTMEGDLADIFSALVGGGRFDQGGPPFSGHTRPMRGHDIQAHLVLDFADAVQGLTTDVVLSGVTGPASRSISVRIPAGVDNGQKIKLAGKGEPGVNGGPPGDLYVAVKVNPHPVFGRQGKNLTVTTPVTFTQAALGANISVPTFEGDPVRLRLPPGSQPGRVLRVRGRGVKTGKGTGDLLVTVVLEVPSELNDEQRQALEAFDKTMGKQS
ncbi:DnaJ C-terminal domain-containing protein [Candidatus Poriferisocius sp.]|uniref:DnaJ C-terminal domain-containing protein n=1 Tax=Candidatus Poriferisocius sp. TaxID=3101276 RepID=UPI003B02142B